MKVVSLFGSPRPTGNTATLLKQFNRTAEALGADVQSFQLNKIQAHGCQACDACKTKADRCVIEDDMAGILEAVRETDVLVAASPIYFAEITAQLKIFVDRCYSYLEPFTDMPTATRLKPGKTFVLITAQNRGEELFGDICKKYLMIFKFLGFAETHLVRGCNLLEADALEANNREDLLALSVETARKVFQPAA